MTDGWTTGIAPPPAPAMSDQERDKLIMAWQATQGQLEIVKTQELKLRNQVIAALWPQATTGTQSLELSGGWKLKGSFTQNFKINREHQPNDPEKTRYGKLIAAMIALSKIDAAGALIAKRLIKWDADLVKKEYEEMPAQYKALIEPLITMSQGQPQLELVAPKPEKT